MAASSEAAALFSDARLEKPAKPLALPRLGVGMAGADNRYVKLNLCGASVFGARLEKPAKPLAFFTSCFVVIAAWHPQHGLVLVCCCSVVLGCCSVELVESVWVGWWKANFMCLIGLCVAVCE